MKRKLVVWAEETSPQLSQLIKRKKCVILPLGSTEQHGPHLPVGTDHLNVWAIACEVAERVDGLVLPLLPYGCSNEHFPCSGTLSLASQTLKNILKDIIESLKTNDVKNIVILNGHGGQSDIVNNTISSLTKEEKIKEIKLLHLSLFSALPVEILAHKIPLEEDAYVHAEEFETSLMLATNPKLVRVKDAVKEIPPWVPRGLTSENVELVKRILKTKFIGRDTETGVIGDPTLASTSKGRKAIRILSDALAEIIKKETL